MTKTNGLKNYIYTPPPNTHVCFNMVTLAFNLKGAFVFPGSIIAPALRYYHRELEEPQRHVWAPIQPSSTHPPPPRCLFMVTRPNKCAVCSVMPYHTSDKVTRVSTSPTAKVTLSSSAFHLLLPREAPHFSSFVSWKYSLTK